MSRNSKYLIGSFTFLFAVILLTNHAYAQGNVSKPIESLKTYQNALFGFQFQYPTDFPQIEERSNEVGFLFNETEAPFAYNGITIQVKDLSESTTLQKYLRAYLAGQPGIKYDTLVVNQTTITAEKIPAVRAEYQSGVGDTSFGKTILYLTIKNNTAYIILYDFGDEIFEKHMPGFQTILDTFKIT